ncbi:unnamed protein product, partial [Ixodes persulcatus]
EPLWHPLAGFGPNTSAEAVRQLREAGPRPCGMHYGERLHHLPGGSQEGHLSTRGLPQLPKLSPEARRIRPALLRVRASSQRGKGDGLFGRRLARGEGPTCPKIGGK